MFADFDNYGNSVRKEGVIPNDLIGTVPCRLHGVVWLHYLREPKTRSKCLRWVALRKRVYLKRQR